MRILKSIQRRVQRGTEGKVDKNDKKQKRTPGERTGSTGNVEKANNITSKQERAPKLALKSSRAAAEALRRPARENQSVADYQDLRDLKTVLQQNEHQNDGGDSASVVSTNGPDDSSLGDHSGGMLSDISGHSGTGYRPSFQPVEWKLPLVDKETTEPETMEQEFQRLQVLQSYFVLDSQGETEFDRITRHTAKLFDVPICLISLVDLGRQWFLSRVGLDATETPRKHAFCAHVILNKHKQLIVPDATQDFRFQNNPLVTDGLKIRFYAGAALVSPEGYKLGTLCLISPTVRPQGLSKSEQETLHELAAMVVSAMVARRTRLLKEEYERKFFELAQIFTDTHSNLKQAQATVQKVLERQSWAMDCDDTFELSATVKSLAVQSQVCSAATRTVLQDVPAAKKRNSGDRPQDENGTKVEDDDDNDNENDQDLLPKEVTLLGDDGQREDENGLLFLDSMLEYDNIVNPTTDMQKLFDNLNSMVMQFPHENVVTMELFKSVPKFIIAEDLLLFRSILNLTTHCMGASHAHPCGIRIRNKKNHTGSNANELLIHCLQGGPLVPYARAKELFHNPESLLAPVATMARTLGGQYGMFHGKWDRNKHKKTNSENTDTDQEKPSAPPLQSIFWLQIPYDLPESDTLPLDVGDGASTAATEPRFRRTQLQVHRPREASDNNHTPASAQQVNDATKSNGNSSNQYLKSDPFLQASLQFMESSGCGHRGTPRQ